MLSESRMVRSLVLYVPSFLCNNINIDIWCCPPTVVGLFFSTMDDDNNGTRLLSSLVGSNRSCDDNKSRMTRCFFSARTRECILKPTYIYRKKRIRASFHYSTWSYYRRYEVGQFFKYFPPSLSARLSNDTNLMSRPRCPLVPFGLPPPPSINIVPILPQQQYGFSSSSPLDAWVC
jgi:hypothetical protein